MLRPLHSPRILVALLLVSFSGGPALCRETIIERLKHYESAIVTVRGQQITSPSQEEHSSGGTALLHTRRISLMEKTGAGVIIAPDGTITTNTHIIFGSHLIKVVLWTGEEFQAQVLFVSPQYDFSIIKIHAQRPLTAIEWADADRLTLGQEIVTIGHSPLLERTLSGGVVAGMGTRTTEDGTPIPEMIKLNINHYQGDSGGPVFDAQGRFIALLNAKRLLQDRSALAIPSSKIHFAYLNLVSPVEKK